MHPYPEENAEPIFLMRGEWLAFAFRAGIAITSQLVCAPLLFPECGLV